ncbi:MAG: DUF455 family protein [Limisphaerales bacterium]
MELREFAEQILFATTLEEKLRCPESVTDEHPGSAIAQPSAPGRPPGLQFKPQGSGAAEFPGWQRLEEERERGRLLHFFANHELLATELMALVLLRFPDAPSAFRRGVLQTLKDEQIHTRLYVDRMRDCGIQFGEIPVSGYFWRAIAAMETPMDYVAGLSLTFEQANLDFCRHFAQGFGVVGDADTARLLDRIYHDEIGHVAYGLKWFRRWKNPQESDWDAFCRQLKFPLSPRRAKGFALNIEGRRAAGLDPHFIAELNVYSQSKGRTPGVFVFNPFAEGSLAHGRGFTPPRSQADLARDLANLPQFLCREDDLVLLPARPSVEFLSDLKQAGFALPEFVELGERRPATEVGDRLRQLARRKLGALRPWAWGPDSVELLGPLFGSVTDGARSMEQCFNERLARLYSKAWSADLLRRVLRSASRSPIPPGSGVVAGAGEVEQARRWADESWLCAEIDVGVSVGSLADALEAVAVIRGRGHHRVVIKEALGLAGHNAIRLWEPEVIEPQRRWMANALERGGQLVVEPWLERVLDFSIQLEMGVHGLKVRGYTGLINDSRGQFQANWAAANHERRLPAQVIALLRGQRDAPQRLPDLYDEVFRQLEAALCEGGYQGPLGIDAFIYRTADGDCRLKPIVEINPRYTMGRLTVELMKRAVPGSHGRFRLVNRTRAQAAGFEDFTGYARALRERSRLRLEGQPVPRIVEGAVCLNDPIAARACLAIFEVSRSANAFLSEGPGEMG